MTNHSTLNLSNFIIFATGAAIGSLVTWKLIKTKYERQAQEEIDSVKEVFSRRSESKEVAKLGEAVSAGIEEGIKEKKPDAYAAIKNYAEKLAENGYVDYANIDKKEVKNMGDRPYVISPEDFGEQDGYETNTLIYFEGDGVLTDDDYNLIDDVDDLVGADFADHFGEYEDDTVFVRNDETMNDYEICRDSRSSSEVI